MALIIPSLLAILLLLCPASASATPAMAPAPALAAIAGGLEAEKLCLGGLASTEAMACVGNVALECLAVDATTAETTFLPCFVTLAITAKCWAGPREAPEEDGGEHCVGMPISDDRARCVGEAAWSCRDSSSSGFFGDAEFIFCCAGAAAKCFM